MYKKIILVIFSTLLFLGLTSNTKIIATDETKVLIDGAEASFAYPVKIIDGTIMVPMKQIFNQLGARVTYDTESKVVLAQHSTYIYYQLIEIALADGYPYVLINDENGERWVNCVPPRIFDGITYVPLRVVGESLRAKVGWDASRKLVTIETTLSKDITRTSDFFIFGLNYHISRDRDKWIKKNGVLDDTVAIQAQKTMVIDTEFINITGETCPGSRVSINNDFLVTSPMGYFSNVYMGKEILDKYIIRVHKDNKIIAEKTILKDEISEKVKEPEILSSEYFECKEGKFKIKFPQDWKVTTEYLPNGYAATAWVYIQPESEKQIGAPIPAHETIHSIFNSDKCTLNSFKESSLDNYVKDMMYANHYIKWEEENCSNMEVNGNEALLIEYNCKDSYGLDENSWLFVTVYDSRIFVMLSTAATYKQEELKAVYEESFESLQFESE